MSEQKVRIAFVGVGSMGQCAHLKNYATLPECEVVALAEVKEELGRNVAAKYGVPRVYRDAAEMIEKEKLEAIYPALYFNDQVVYCDYTRGKYDIVLLMKGTSFSEIETTIRTKFKTLDGVLRIKEWPILTLFEA